MDADISAVPVPTYRERTAVVKFGARPDGGDAPRGYSPFHDGVSRSQESTKWPWVQDSVMSRSGISPLDGRERHQRTLQD